MGKTKAAQGKPRLDYPKTILTGFGFMATTLTWAIYDPYVTKILNKLLTNSELVASWNERIGSVPFLEPFMAINTVGKAGAFTLVPLFIGVIMTFDNVFGVVFQPLFGKLSDGCHSRLGKRRPFMLYGAPVAAVFFALIPWMNSLPAVMACVILFVFVMSIWRAPVVALMPDLTPPELRSSGNAVINLVGGVGGILGLAAGTLVTVVFAAVTGTPKDQIDEFKTFPYVFLFGAVLMLVCLLVVMLFVKEKDSRLLSADTLAARSEAERKAAEKKAKAEEKIARKAMKLTAGEKRSLGFMLVCLFFLFAGSNSIQTFFALFADEILHISTAQASLLVNVLVISGALAAIPSGWLGRKLGRKKTILLGLGLFLSAFAIFFAALITTASTQGLTINGFVSLNLINPNAPQVTAIMNSLNWLIYPVLVLAGFSSMAITVNTLPLVLEIGGIERVGTFTGYYYTATFSAQIAAPITYGIFRSLSGSYISLFYYCPVMLVLSLLMILFVRHGEAVPQEVIDKAEEQGA